MSQIRAFYGRISIWFCIYRLQNQTRKKTAFKSRFFHISRWFYIKKVPGTYISSFKKWLMFNGETRSLCCKIPFNNPSEITFFLSRSFSAAQVSLLKLFLHIYSLLLTEIRLHIFVQFFLLLSFDHICLCKCSTVMLCFWYF